MSRVLASKVAWGFLGTPYIWGGDDPMKGFDCSGFVIEILKSVGALPRTGDWTAKELWDKFDKKVIPYPNEGCLVFWRGRARNSAIVHVEYCIDDTHSIGASGGGRKTETVADAIKQNAYIKVRPFSSRKYIRGYVDPFQ